MNDATPDRGSVEKRWPLVCDACGSQDLAFGVCRRCGWRSAATLENDARLRKAGVPKVRQPPERGARTKPAYVVETLGGEIVRTAFKCPECRGRGWTLNACNSCGLCFGHGTISGVRLAKYRQGR